MSLVTQPPASFIPRGLWASPRHLLSQGTAHLLGKDSEHEAAAARDGTQTDTGQTPAWSLCSSGWTETWEGHLDPDRPVPFAVCCVFFTERGTELTLSAAPLRVSPASVLCPRAQAVLPGPASLAGHLLAGTGSPVLKFAFILENS